MSRTFRAFVWLRWRLLVNALRGGQRRDRFEQISRILALFVPLIIVVMSLGSLIAITFVGYIGGHAVANGVLEPQTFLRVVRLVLLALLAVIVGFAIWSPTQSSLSRYTRLLLLPISKRSLHATEFAAAATDPWIILLVPGLLAVAVGMAVGGRGDAAVVMVAAGGLLLATLVGVASLLGFLVGWLFRSRRRSELFTLLFVMVFSLASLLPVMLGGLDEPRVEVGTPAAEAPVISQDDVDRLMVWTQGLPSELYARAVRGGLERDRTSAGLAMLVLAGQSILLFLLSSAVHGRMLGAVEGDRGRGKAGSRAGHPWRVPLLGPAAAAVAAAQTRTALRTVRGRLAILLPGPLLAMLAVIIQQIPGESQGLVDALAEHSHVLLAGGIVVSLYSLQPFTMNLFGADRSGLTMQFLQPVSDVDLAKGKLAGLAMVLAATTGLCLVTALAATRAGSPTLWAATLVGGAATYVWLSPAFVWLSALFPVPADLSKTGFGGNPHALSATVGTLLVPLVAAPAVLIMLAVELWFDQSAWALLGMLAWLGLAVVVCVPLLRWSARGISFRRENLAIVAQGR